MFRSSEAWSGMLGQQSEKNAPGDLGARNSSRIIPRGLAKTAAANSLEYSGYELITNILTN